RTRQRGVDGLDERTHGELEDRPTLHVQCGLALRDRVLGRRLPAPAGADADEVRQRALASQVGRKEATVDVGVAGHDDRAGAVARATRAAFVASVAVDSWSAAMRRSRMPVFSRIHPSSTPKCCSSSALSMTVGGTSDPHPAKRNGVMRFAMVFLYGSCSRAAE